MKARPVASVPPPAVAEFVALLRSEAADAEVSVEAGGEAGGNWWIDSASGDTSVALEWHPAAGFRLYDPDSDGYGEGPLEVFRSPALAARRVGQFLKARTVPPIGGWLRQLRELHGLSQETLAARLAIQQAAVSKMERRSELLLSSLAAATEALGGRLEIRAHFPDCDVSLSPPASLKTRSSS
jgi:hypothetical protein